MRIFLARHGQTVYNIEKRIQGWSDSPLTDLGINQAKQLGEYLKDIDFNIAYSSDAKRALETLKLAIADRDIDIIDRDIDSLLNDYMQLNEKLKVLDKGNDDELPPLDESMRKDAFKTMIEITNSMDYGMMETLLDDIKNYRLNEEDEALFSRIRKLLLELDWDGISEELKSIEL